MKSDVFFLNARCKSDLESLSAIKTKAVLGEIGLDGYLQSGMKVCIKTHFGALNNTRYLRPSYARAIVDHVKTFGVTDIIVAESCGAGLPNGSDEWAGRASEPEYLECAKRHGFTPDTMGCPVTMLDGPLGLEWFSQEIEGKYFKEVLVAGKLKDIDALIMQSHFKGHEAAGFGGAIKNLGIGCVSKGGKSEAHHGKRMEIKQEACPEDCEACITICPSGALMKSEDGYIVRDQSACRKCRFCQGVCKDHMFVYDTNISQEQFITQMVDNAFGVVSALGQKKIFYINYAIDIVPQCDCSGASDVPFVPDIGVLASKDPVALDQACVDLVNQSAVVPYSKAWDMDLGEETEKFSYIYGKKDDPPNKAWEVQLQAAEEIGLGSRTYELVNMDE
ncbi:MAG TPA: DUF362 domain-containing protein [Candidatus Lokiarchaeia archaeon]|nr:DUF362 domain-containing protein [Candidatus Lokiarchaeia archaeon]